MEDDKGYLYKKNKMYKGTLYLYCVNKFQKVYKCPAHVKALPDGSLEYITNHNASCMMERLRKNRGIERKKPKRTVIRKKKPPPIPIRIPTKIFNKISVEEYFSSALEVKENDTKMLAEDFQEEIILKEVEQEAHVDSNKIKNDIADTLRRISENIKKKKLKKLQKFLLKK